MMVDNSNIIYFYLLFFILFVLFLNFMITHLRYKRQNNLKREIKMEYDIDVDTLRENSECMIGTKIEGEEYFISINKSNNRLILSPDKKKACHFIIETPDLYKDEGLMCLKIENIEPSVYMNYVYPDIFSTKYKVLGSEENYSNTCLLRFNFNKKHKKFIIKFDNGMNLCYDRDSLELYCSSVSDKTLKKLLVFLEKV